MTSFNYDGFILWSFNLSMQSLIDELTQVTEKIMDNDESNPATPLDTNKLWEQILAITEADAQSLQYIVTMLKLYGEFDNKFTDEVAPILKEKIDSWGKLSSKEEKNNYSNMLFRNIPFMESTAAANVMSNAINYIHDLAIEENEDIINFVEPLGEVFPDTFKEEQLEKFVENVKDKFNENAMIFIAPMAHSLFEEREDFADLVLGNMLQYLDGTDKQKLAALILIIYIAEHFEHDPEYIEKNGKKIFESFKSLLISENNVLRKFASKAFRELISCHAFYTPEYLEEFLKMYPQFKKEMQYGFLKILTTFISPSTEDGCCGCEEEDCQCEDSLSIIQPILNFVLDGIKGTDLYTKGICLDAFSSLGEKEKLYVEDDVELALNEAENLIKAEEYDTYEFISCLFKELSQDFPETKEKISQLIPVLFEKINNENIGNLKHRIYMATSIATIVGKVKICTELIPQIQEFIKTIIDTKDEKLICLVCDVAHPVCKSFQKDFANQFFNSLCDQSKETKDFEYLDIMIHILCKLIKNSLIEEPNATAFVESIMNSQFKFFNGEKVYQILPPCDPVYEYLSQYVLSFSSKAAEICQQIVDWITETPFDCIPPLFMPLTNGIKNGCFKINDATKLASTLKKYMKGLDDKDFGAVESLCEILSALFTSFPGALNPISEIIESIKHFIDSASSITCEEEEEDLEEDDFFEKLQAIPHLVNFIFNVYANDEEVEIDEEVLEKSIALLPVPPDLPINYMNDIMYNLSQMLNDSERFESVLVPGLKLITEILLMKKSNLEEYEFEDDTISEMKSTLKDCCKGNKQLQNEIIKDFGKSRAKINRFNALIR